MEIVRGFVPHPLQVNPFENLQRHVQRWPLTPGSAGIYIIAFVGDVRRRFDTNRKCSEIFVGQQPPFLCMEIGNFPGNFTPVNQIARGSDSRFPITPAPRSASIIRWKVLARSFWKKISPIFGICPPGLKTSVVDGRSPSSPLTKAWN